MVFPPNNDLFWLNNPVDVLLVVLLFPNKLPVFEDVLLLNKELVLFPNKLFPDVLLGSLF